MAKDIKTPTEIKTDAIQRQIDRLYGEIKRKPWKTEKPTETR